MRPPEGVAGVCPASDPGVGPGAGALGDPVPSVWTAPASVTRSGARTDSGRADQKCVPASTAAPARTTASAVRARRSRPHRDCTHSGNRSRSAGPASRHHRGRVPVSPGTPCDSVSGSVGGVAAGLAPELGRSRGATAQDGAGRERPASSEHGEAVHGSAAAAAPLARPEATGTVDAAVAPRSRTIGTAVAPRPYPCSCFSPCPRFFPCPCPTGISGTANASGSAPGTVGSAAVAAVFAAAGRSGPRRASARSREAAAISGSAPRAGRRRRPCRALDAAPGELPAGPAGRRPGLRRPRPAGSDPDEPRCGARCAPDRTTGGAVAWTGGSMAICAGRSVSRCEAWPTAPLPGPWRPVAQADAGGVRKVMSQTLGTSGKIRRGARISVDNSPVVDNRVPRRGEIQRGATTAPSRPGPVCAPITAPTSLTCRSPSPGSRPRNRSASRSAPSGAAR